ncbi:hypothetical protein [Mycobacterium sp. 48b]|uniref:hypothetical protein n=1 Tax=Mycobacterium sp. 48b TaxID=3400426 RepID=UPI003AAC2695
MVLPQFLPTSGPVLPTLFVLADDRARNILNRTHIRSRIERAMAVALVVLGLGLGADAR